MILLQQALEGFLTSEEFKQSVISATRAAYSGSGYSVELFEDDTWRVLWNNQIGNQYQSPGIILPIPTLDDDCPSDFLSDCFDNNAAELEEEIRLYLIELERE